MTLSANATGFGGPSGHQQLLRQEALARKEGIPLTEAGLRKYRSYREDENAAPLYRKSGTLLEEVRKKNPDAWGKLDLYNLGKPGVLEADRNVVALAEPAMKIVALACRRPVCDLGIKLPDSGSKFQILSDFRYFARIACAKAQLLAHDGHAAQALEELGDFAPLSGHIAQEPNVFVALVHVAVDAIFTRVIGDILAQHGKDPGVAETALKCVYSLGPMPNLALIAEAEGVSRLGELNAKNFPPSIGPDIDPDMARGIRTLTQMAKRPGVLDSWRAHEIESTRKFVALFKHTDQNLLELERRCDAIDIALSRPDDNAHAWRSILGAFIWSQAIDTFALTISQRRVLAQASALLASSSTSNQLPIGGVTSRDPFTGKALHYDRTARGFKIYGVGRRGVDHGGRSRSPGLTPNDYDVVFEYPAPEVGF